MSLATIKLDESNKLEFGVTISGADGLPETRLVIESQKFSVAFPCQPTQGGVEAVITEMKHILPAGEYPIRMEVIIDNKIYTPFKDTITFEPLVEIVTTPKATTRTKSVSEQSAPKLAVQESQPFSIQVTPVKTTATKTISEEESKQMAMAKLVAKNLDFSPTSGMTPSNIIEQALLQAPQLTSKRRDSVVKLLKLAESAGVEFDRSLLG